MHFALPSVHQHLADKASVLSAKYSSTLRKVRCGILHAASRCPAKSE